MTASVQLSKMSEFLRFDVALNEIPMETFYGNREKEDFKNLTSFQRGKDVVIDWEFLDGFDTEGKLWIDSNGLDMHEKRLWQRQEFNMTPTTNIASNFYPVSSAIAIRDKSSKKQVTVLTDRS